MAVSASTAVWEHSPATGNARLVELYLADRVNERSLRAGHPAIAWASQRTLAKVCRCARSTVQEALEELQELGRITDTGQRKQRGTVMWELHLTENRSSQAGDLTENRSSPDGWTENQSSGNGDRTDSASDWTDPQEDWTGNRAGTGPTTGHKPDENRKSEPGYQPEPRDVGGARDQKYGEVQGRENRKNSNTDPCLVPAGRTRAEEQRRRAIEQRRAEELREVEADLEKLEKQVATSRNREKTEAAIETLRARRGELAPAEVAT